ncbi:hypothetical protein BDE02_01G272000 [Populus trichocarpa]|nr:hypothetical protein BDE02_01G272000 [Populus trichocarpa]
MSQTNDRWVGGQNWTKKDRCTLKIKLDAHHPLFTNLFKNTFMRGPSCQRSQVNSNTMLDCNRVDFKNYHPSLFHASSRPSLQKPFLDTHSFTCG